jgi:hypothetical protein
LATSGPIILAADDINDDYEYEVVGGMIIGRGNRSIWRKAAPFALSPSQIPYDLT